MSSEHVPSTVSERDNPFRALDAFLKYLGEIDTLLDVCRFSVISMKGYARLTEMAAAASRSPPPDIEFARKLESSALNEASNGFPLLMSHSVVALWSALEETIPRICIDWLVADPSLLAREPFTKIKLSPDVILVEDRSLLMEEIVQELARSTQSALKPGIGRFDALVAAIGIKLRVPDHIRRELFELSKVRNVIVHQFGRADRKFIRECPWLNLQVGQRVKISIERYIEYKEAVREYCACIVQGAAVETENSDPAPGQ